MCHVRLPWFDAPHLRVLNRTAKSDHAVYNAVCKVYRLLLLALTLPWTAASTVTPLCLTYISSHTCYCTYYTASPHALQTTAIATSSI